MGAGVSDGIISSLDVEECDSLPLDCERRTSAWRQVLNFSYFEEVCHRAAIDLAVGERLWARGPSLALFMVMRVTGLIGWRVGNRIAGLQESCINQVGFHFFPTHIGEQVAVNLDTGGKGLPALFNHLRVECRVVDDICDLRRPDCIFAI